MNHNHNHSNLSGQPPWTHESLTVHLKWHHGMDVDAEWDTDSLTCEHENAHDAHGDPCGRVVGPCHLGALDG